MATLAQLKKQREELDAQIALVEVAEKDKALNQILSIIGEYGLTQEDLAKLFGKGTKSTAKSATKIVIPKGLTLRNPDDPKKEWKSGPGKRPEWVNSMAPNQLEALIQQATVTG